jgi:hypothetical protein
MVQAAEMRKVHTGLVHISEMPKVLVHIVTMAKELVQMILYVPFSSLPLAP